MHIPFFRFLPDPDALAGIEECLQSGWLTTGPKVKQFEQDFVNALGNPELHAVALNSCTAALHLALEAIGLKRGDRVLVPTMTFAATAEVVRYFDAIPILCDVDPDTLCITPTTIRAAISQDPSSSPLPTGRGAGGEGRGAGGEGRFSAIIPVHYGGRPCDLEGITAVASEVGAEVIEDAAHAFPAGWRGSVAQSAERVAPTSRTDHADTGETAESENATRSVLRATPPAHRSSPLSNPIHYVGNNTSKVSCFSFYANKTITTGEGGMAVTADAELAARMRLMSLHGMNRDAWKRFTADGSWDYHIVAPGFKYNMTDVAAALGLSQLAKAEQFRLERARIASFYDDAFADVEEVETLPQNSALLHAHHLYVIKLRLDLLRIDRAQFIEEMKQRGVLCSVHWRPLHMHPYYVESYGYKPEDFPVAASLWPRLLSLPIYPGLTDEEMAYVAESVVEMLRRARL